MFSEWEVAEGAAGDIPMREIATFYSKEMREPAEGRHCFLAPVSSSYKTWEPMLASNSTA